MVGGAPLRPVGPQIPCVAPRLRRFFRPLALSTISALLYFAVRSTLDVRPKAFWAEPWPASCFFLVLWAFQASLIPSGSCAELAAPLAGWAGVDAGGAWQRLMSGTCLEAAAALMLFQLALLALDLLAGAPKEPCEVHFGPVQVPRRGGVTVPDPAPCWRLWRCCP